MPPVGVALSATLVAIVIQPMQVVAADAFTASALRPLRRSAVVNKRADRALTSQSASLLGFQRSTRLEKTHIQESREIDLSQDLAAQRESFLGLQRSKRLQKVSASKLEEKPVYPISHVSLLGLQRRVRGQTEQQPDRDVVSGEPVQASLLGLQRSLSVKETKQLSEQRTEIPHKSADGETGVTLRKAEVSDDLGLQSGAEVIPAPSLDRGSRAGLKGASLFGLQRSTKISKGFFRED
eukprot:TRINITY_DN69780_c0_g1_i1.p1 TRINITY_DN69780_c0_g1~~TRINITY_DN69780_c0_g1_i1.p1  ORF type:complete len:263 (+),score=23.36 TRINITY_DN69780_c0_g1_i1:78-791(+)